MLTWRLFLKKIKCELVIDDQIGINMDVLVDALRDGFEGKQYSDIDYPNRLVSLKVEPIYTDEPFTFGLMIQEANEEDS